MTPLDLFISLTLVCMAGSFVMTIFLLGVFYVGSRGERP